MWRRTRRGFDATKGCYELLEMSTRGMVRDLKDPLVVNLGFTKYFLKTSFHNRLPLERSDLLYHLSSFGDAKDFRQL